MSARKKLMEEIYDQFLVCKICYEVYSRPKTLSCLHTFCEACIAKQHDAERQRAYRYLLYATPTVTCPLCSKKSDLPPGGVRRLPDDFIVPRLVDIVCGPCKQYHVTPRSTDPRHTRMTLTCEICKSTKSSSRRSGSSHFTASMAVTKCLDCSKMLCSSCTELHRLTKVTERHSLVDVEVEEKDIACRTHDGELIRFYCEPCGACICVVCAFQQPHHDHDVSTFSEAISRHRHALDGLLARCRDRADELRAQLQLTARWVVDVRNAEQQVRDAVVDCVTSVRRRETELLTELRAGFASDPGVQAFVADRPSIEATLQGLENTCQLTDIIVRERSVELLLLKDDIAQRMTSLLQKSLAQPPPHMCTSHVRFTPTPRDQAFPVGRLDFVNETIDKTSLEETDRPQGDGHDAVPDGAADTDDQVQDGGYRPEVEIRRQKMDDDVEDVQEGGSFEMREKRLIETCDRETMTSSLSCVKSVSTTMNRGVHCDDKLTATSSQLTVDRSTLTAHPAELCHRATVTDSAPDLSSNVKLISQISQTSASVFQLRSETEPPSRVNRWTSTERPFQMDKKVSTTRLLQSSRETNTPHVFQLDIGLDTPRLPGHEVACSTKVIVTADVSTLTDTVRNSSAMTAQPRGRQSVYSEVNWLFITPTDDQVDRLYIGGRGMNDDPVCQDFEDPALHHADNVHEAASDKEVLLENNISFRETSKPVASPTVYTGVQRSTVATDNASECMTVAANTPRRSFVSDSANTAITTDVACDTADWQHETTTNVDTRSNALRIDSRTVASNTEMTPVILRRANSLPSRIEKLAKTKHRTGTAERRLGILTHNIPNSETATTYQSTWFDNEEVAPEGGDGNHDNNYVVSVKQVPVITPHLCSQCRTFIDEENAVNTNISDSSALPYQKDVTDYEWIGGKQQQWVDEDKGQGILESTANRNTDSAQELCSVIYQDRAVGNDDVFPGVERGVGSGTVWTVNRGTGERTVWSVDAETWTPTVTLCDRATVMRSVVLLHKNESTDSQQTVSVATSPAEDITSTYRGLLAAVQPRAITVNRGTMTAPAPVTTDRETATEHRKLVDCGTSPAVDITAAYRGAVGARLVSSSRVTVSRGTLTAPLPTQPVDKNTITDCTVVDRASSPIKIIQVDKSVLVNRASFVESTDVFVRSAPAPQTGNKVATAAIMTSYRRLSGSCPRMDSICEGSDENSSSSEGEMGSTFRPVTVRGRLPPLARPCFSAGSATDSRQLQRKGTQHRVTPRPPGQVEKKGVCSSVEVGTNTSSVEQHDKATSTESMCGAVVDGKMAECISKLRTVRQRLEQQQPSTPRNTSSPESTPATPPQPVNEEHSPPRLPSPTAASHVTPPHIVSQSKDTTERSCDQEVEVQQFILELKSRTAQQTSPELSKRLVQSVPGKSFVADRKRLTGSLTRQDQIPEFPTSSPRRPRRSTSTDAETSRQATLQRSYSPRAPFTRNGRSLDGPTAAGSHYVRSPTQRRTAATKKLSGISSPPTPPRSRAAVTNRATRPQSAKSESTPPACTPKSPLSSPGKIRLERTSASEAQRLTTIDDEQARSTSDSDSLLTHSGGSSDDQDHTARPPATPTLARKQRLDMTQLLSAKDQSPGGATSVKQVRSSPTVARRATQS